MRFFHGRTQQELKPFTPTEISLLLRENREAARGGMNPFALNSGPDAMTKLLGMNLKMNTPAGIIGNSSYFEPEDTSNE